ncbi:CatB-related O-acetyltransferase [Flagellimonas sp. GZD32]|uniref:CatB-related O-acetyltransferase n=1 Tax=Flagellimonas cixiensis TaxID=3228750 RepID=UPI0035C8CA1A
MKIGELLTLSKDTIGHIYFMTGVFLKNIYAFLYKKRIANKYRLRLDRDVTIDKKTTFEGQNALIKGSSLISSHIGFGSYIAERGSIRHCKIGKYCSIGPDVKCVFGKHPTSKFVSTHPAFFSVQEQAGFTYTNEQLFEEYETPSDPDGKFQITIGNDVWIGAAATLMDGITIGDGAIVAANALVTNDVPPYSIVGGIPAKIIKKRFSENQIQSLLKIQWWDQEEAWIRKNASKFTDIDHFIETFKGRDL